MTLHSDPWGQLKETASIRGGESASDQLSLTFEDNFNDKLPDSQQYLAILEEKLRRIKNNPDILKQLAEKREACMRELLSNENQPSEETDDDLDEPVETPQILRVINQKQALTRGELVELIDYDQLAESDCESN